MNNVLITEGELDKVLIQSLLRTTSDSDTVYIAAGGWSSADSLARSYLTDPKTKVVVVVDADTSDPNLVEERRRFLSRSLGQIADTTRWHVLVIEPEIERLLFDDKAILEEFVQQRVSDTDFVEGQFKPKAVLQRISGTPMKKLYKRLDEIDLGLLRNNPALLDIRRFLTSKRSKAVA